MFRNYLTVALRAITRNKLTSFINVFGLALAMSCTVLIFLYIKDELSYDRYHAKADRIYRVTRNFLSPDGSESLHLGHLAPPFAPLLKNDFGEFEEVARTLESTFLLAHRDEGIEKKSFNQENVFFAEPAIFNIFSIDVTKGSPDKSLTDPFTVLLSEQTAEKFFGQDSPIGKTLKVGNAFDVTVTGTFKDFPDQSHWHPSVFISFSTLNDSTIYGRKSLETRWGNNSFSTYILARQPLDIGSIEKQFPAFIDKHMGFMSSGDNGVMPSSWTTLFLQKLTDIHLYSNLDSEIEANGNINNVYMMAVVAVFIILIACFNFVNLSTARATTRAKEVGLRKVVGAFRNQLIFQYLSESVLITLFSLISAMAISALALPWLNEFTSKHLSLNLFENPLLAGGLVAFALFTGIIAGIYPAFVISGYRPALILKGKNATSKTKGSVRKILVVTQFSISIVLIIATLITFEQLRFLNNRDLGYNRDQIITLQLYDELSPSYDAFYNELTKSSTIRNVTRSSIIPTGRLLNSQGSAKVQENDSLVASNVILKNVDVDFDFFNTYEIAFVSGRNFSKTIPTDDSVAFILNESAVQMMGEDPEEILTKEFEYGEVRGRVIGVVKDFHFESLHEEIVPVVFQARNYFNRISIKTSGGNTQAAISDIEKVWKNFLPNRPFEYEFLSSQYSHLYDKEMKQGQLFTIFSTLAVLIASLGLFGLATFSTLQRVKEIGIRKVLGASVSNIVRLLSTEIVILVAVATLVACPVAWYFTDQWLNNFAYHISSTFGLYIVSAVIAVVIALTTVAAQTIKAAAQNPINSLRHE